MILLGCTHGANFVWTARRLARKGRAIGAVALLGVGCEQSPAADAGPLVRDSTGIEIVELQQSPWGSGPRWTVSAQPLLDIGVAVGDPQYELYDVTSAARLSDGRIVIANSGTGELRMYSADGTYVRSMGRAGDGPGEFQDLQHLQILAGDTLVVQDGSILRITAFTVDGELAWTHNLLGGTGDLWAGPTRLPDGTFLSAWESGDVVDRMGDGTLTPGSTVRGTAEVLHHRSNGSPGDTLAVVPSVEYAIYRSSGRLAVGYPPWGRRLSYTVLDGRVFVGTQETFEIREYGLVGGLVRLIRGPSSDLSLREDHIEEYEASVFARLSDDLEIRRMVREQMDQVPVAGGLPAYGRFLPGPAGGLWISQAFFLGSQPSRWILLDPAVGVLAEVELPDGFQVFEFGVDYILGLGTDESNIEHVRIYGLERGEDDQPGRVGN